MAGSRARGWLLDVTLAAAAASAAAVLTTELTTGLPASARALLLSLAVVHGGVLILRWMTPRAVLAVQAVTAIAYVAIGLPVFMLAYPLYGLIGVAAGALIVFQPVAVLLPLAWVLFLEDFVLRLAPYAVTPWTLNGVTAALAHAAHVAEVLPMAVGGGVLLAYALLLFALGAARLTYRDIT